MHEVKGSVCVIGVEHEHAASCIIHHAARSATLGLQHGGRAAGTGAEAGVYWKFGCGRR